MCHFFEFRKLGGVRGASGSGRSGCRAGHPVKGRGGAFDGLVNLTGTELRADRRLPGATDFGQGGLDPIQFRFHLPLSGLQGKYVVLQLCLTISAVRDGLFQNRDLCLDVQLGCHRRFRQVFPVFLQRQAYLLRQLLVTVVLCDQPLVGIVLLCFYPAEFVAHVLNCGIDLPDGLSHNG